MVFAMTSRSSTERLGDFSSESVVSHLVSWVSSCVACLVFWLGVGFWLCCLGFVLGDTWLLVLTYSPTCGNSQSKTIRFDDRLSLERARHELKKKWNSTWGVSKEKKHSRAPGLVHTPHCDEWVGADRWRSEFINCVPPNPAVCLEQLSDSLLLRGCTWTCYSHVNCLKARQCPSCPRGRLHCWRSFMPLHFSIEAR